MGREGGRRNERKTFPPLAFWGRSVVGLQSRLQSPETVRLTTVALHAGHGFLPIPSPFLFHINATRPQHSQVCGWFSIKGPAAQMAALVRSKFQRVERDRRAICVMVCVSAETPLSSISKRWADICQGAMS